jgi:hypothetical protein
MNSSEILIITHPSIQQTSRSKFKPVHNLKKDEEAEFADRYKNSSCGRMSDGDQSLLADQIVKSILLKRKMRERLELKKSKAGSKK